MVLQSLIAWIVIVLVTLASIVLFVFVKYKLNTNSGRVTDEENANATHKYSNWHNSISMGANVDEFSMELLGQVTDNFNDKNILGKGGFGVVYRGELDGGTAIAVKRVKYATSMSESGTNEFQAEISVLKRLRHRHLVSLLGYCVHENEGFLVYEFVPQGTLAQHLFERRKFRDSPLTWKQRVSIALDVARAVDYLHNMAEQSLGFIHRDLKPSNILLGIDLRAKVSDFGLVKYAPAGKTSFRTRVAGTFGYLAPEYAETGKVTKKVDIYAFGVILMELITGRKAVDDRVDEEEEGWMNRHLVTWFRRVLKNKDISNAIDQTLSPDEETLKGIYEIAQLAGHCTVPNAHRRPDIFHVVNVLSPSVENWKPVSTLIHKRSVSCGSISTENGSLFIDPSSVNIKKLVTF